MRGVSGARSVSQIVGSFDMQRPIISLLVAIGLAILGGALSAPVSGNKAALGPDGQFLHHPAGRPVTVRDPYQGLRVNWPAYLCFLGAAASLAWTLFLVGFGIFALIRQRPNKRAARERRDCALVPTEDHRRGVGEP